MAKLTPQQLAAKWQSKLTNATDAYKAGVMAVQQNPAQLAIAAAPRWQAAVSSSEALSRYTNGLGQVSLSDWKTACTDKGASNLAAGARLGAVKVEKMERIMGPIRDAIVAGLPARGNASDNEQRMLQMIREMRAARARG